MNKLKATIVKLHDCLGMTLDFSKPGRVTVDMRKYIENMIEYFSVDLNNNKKTPAGDWLFETRKLQIKNKMKQNSYTMTKNDYF